MSLPEYNGHANYPTFSVASWLSNDPASLAHATEVVTHHVGLAAAADALEEHVATELLSEEGTVDAGLDTDLLGWALGQVDWRRLAQSFAEAAE